MSLLLYQPQSFMVLHSGRSAFQLEQFSPHLALRSYVSCYWRLSLPTPSFDSPFTLRLLPDGCVDLTFVLTQSSQGPLSLITGLMKEPQDITHLSDNPIDLLAIRFLPGGAYSLLKVPLHHLSLEWMPFQFLLEKQRNELQKLEEKLYVSPSILEKIQFLDHFLLDKLELVSKDSLFFASLELILQKRGTLALSQLAKKVEMSPRHLRRKFDEYLELSPKTFSRLLRMQNLMNIVGIDQKINWADIAYQFGYYDQAHFIHDFQKWVGFSPQVYLQKKRRMADFSNTSFDSLT